jgi:hypothetical protein
LCKSNIFICQINLIACNERSRYTQTDSKLSEKRGKFHLFGIEKNMKTIANQGSIILHVWKTGAEGKLLSY